jgi:HipA-like protein
MLSKLKNWFSKGDEVENGMFLPDKEKTMFILKVDNLDLGVLRCENGEWIFYYTNEFKKHRNEYNRIIGFPDLDREYRSEELWPFFRIRIPGLKQPAVQEILKKENIDKDNEVELLKRFGRKTIANPYELILG